MEKTESEEREDNMMRRRSREIEKMRKESV